MKVFYPILFVLLFAAYSADAQSYIQGKVQAVTSGQALDYANVVLLRASDSTFLRGTACNEDGSFRIAGDTVACLLRFSAVGCQTKYVPVPAVRGKMNLGIIGLQESSTALESVNVTAERPLFSVDGEKALYNTSEDLSIQSGTASDALQNAPGVEVDAEGNITLRGAQSVTVWINDQPSHLEGEALKQYIKTLPANAIERIEVIKNPSARYGGGSPVVNIVTNRKVQRNEFFSVGFNANLSSATPMWDPWISYVYANEKLQLNFHLSGSYSSYGGQSSSSSQMLQPDSTLASERSDHASSEEKRWGSYFGFNGSYRFNERNSISGWFGAYPSLFSDKENDTSQWTQYYPRWQNNNHIENQSNNGTYAGGWGGLNYEHKFRQPGHKLSVNANVNFNGNNSKSVSERNFEEQTQLNFRYDRAFDWKNSNFSLSADYVLPFGDKDSSGMCRNEWETGVSQGYTYGKIVKVWDTVDFPADRMIRDASRSYRMMTQSNTTEAYTTLARRMGGFTVKAGLRLTHTLLSAEYADKEGFDFEKKYTYLTPSLHLSYMTKSMHTFGMSYTRRCTPPGGDELSRFIDYGTDEYSTGNPDLRPSYAHRFDMEWNKYFQKFGNVGLDAYLNGNTDEIGLLTDVVYSDYFGRVVCFDQPFNIGHSRSMGMDAYVTYRPSAFCNIRFSAGLSDNYYHFLFREGEWKTVESLNYSLRLNVWTKLWDKVQLFADAYYRSRSQSVFEFYEPSKGVNAGMNADFFKRKLSVYVRVNDVFRWTNWNSGTDNPYYQSSNSWRYDSRFVTLGFTLRFGKMELESMAGQGGGNQATPSGPGKF